MPLPTPHVAEGRYRIPADLLYLTKNQLDFCDIMFFLAHLEGSRFSLATRDFAWLFNKSAPGDRGYANARQVWGKHWRWARRQGWLEETTPEYNLALGKRRAEAVGAYLSNHGGLGSDRVRTVSYGEAADRLVASSAHGPGTEGWENRRVALVIDHSGD